MAGVAAQFEDPSILQRQLVTNSVQTESVSLWNCPENIPEGFVRNISATTTNGIQIQTSYVWPKRDDEFGFPLHHFNETRITGLTTQPIVLRDYFSQTYGAHRHNELGEHFMFEPRLEPGLSEAMVGELEASNVRLIYLLTFVGGNAPSVIIQGIDGQFRLIQ